MNKITKKLAVMIIAVVIMLELVMPVLKIMPNTSLAYDWSYKNLFYGHINDTIYGYFMKGYEEVPISRDLYGKFRLYSNSEVIKNKRISLGMKDGKNVLSFYDGVSFKIMRSDRDDRSLTMVYLVLDNNRDNLIYVDSHRYSSEIKLTSNMLDEYKSKYNTDYAQFAIKVIKPNEGRGADTESVSPLIFVSILKNEIQVGFEYGDSYEENGFMEDKTIYILPNSLLHLKNSTFSFSDYTIATEGAACTRYYNLGIESIGNIGDTGIVTQKMPGFSISAPVVVSNLRSSYFDIQGCTYQNNRKYNGITANRSVAVDWSDPVINIFPYSQCKYNNIDLSGFEVKDEFNNKQTATVKTMNNGYKYYQVRLNFKERRYILISNKNYKNETYYEYVEVYGSGNPQIKNPPVIDSQTDPNSSSQEEIHNEPKQSQEEVYHQDDHSQDVPYPVVRMVDVVEDSNTGKVTYHFECENCAFVKSKIIKRINDAQKNIPEYYGYWSSNDDYIVKIKSNYTSDTKKFTVTIDPQYGEGIYDIIVPVYRQQQFSDGSVWYHDVRYEFYRKYSMC